MLYADLILPLPLANTFTYEVPDTITTLEQGMRVVVQFGAKKIHTALVHRLHTVAPENYRAKPILAVLDEQPVVHAAQFDFWYWIADYYACPIGAVMKAALPSGLKLSSETVILPKEHQEEHSLFTKKEVVILEALQQKKRLALTDIVKIVDQKTVFPIIKSLIEKGVVDVLEELNDKYKPKLVRIVQLHIAESDLSQAIISCQKAPKQLAILKAFLQQKEKHPKKDIYLNNLLRFAEASHSSINALVKKGIFRIEEVAVDRLSSYEEETESSKSLSPAQTEAYQEIQKNFQQKDVILFHGVTSSGKTEVYVQLIKDTLAQGKQVLFLLPEIALTTQIIKRLQRYFGDLVGVYHSKFNENERVEVWYEVLQGNRFPIVLGARSSLFLPFTNLGLIIVDESHETTYKQQHPAPRYNGRDLAVVLAKKQGAKVLLGSATPSLESYTNALNSKYGLVCLKERFGGVQMPLIEIVDLKYAHHRKQMKGPFSNFLLEKIEAVLAQKEQLILFQNRRGFAPVSVCKSCGWTAKCHSCDVSLTYHKKIDLIKCHYCGYSETPLKKCKACGSLEVDVKGLGTEKIEEELQLFFPDASIQRLDYDTTSKKHAHQDIITAFEEKRIDILIGTQMVTKGLDFDNVSLVGILNADTLLNFPDFRSFERAYQLMAQVAGRSGRKQKRGNVIIQTYSPENPIIKSVQDNDYENMYRNEMIERKNFLYPPFCKLIQITTVHKDYQLTNRAARDLAILMRLQFGKNVLGPEYPSVARIKNKFLKHVLLKVEGTALHQAKSILNGLTTQLNNHKDYKSVRFILDVDPV